MARRLTCVRRRLLRQQCVGAPGLHRLHTDVRNTGPGRATSAEVTASLPAGTIATGLSPGCTASGGTVVRTFADLVESAVATAGFKVPPSRLSLGRFAVEAARTASSPDGADPADDTSSASCVVISLPPVTC